MPVNQTLDSLQFPDLAFPYNLIRGELLEEPPRLVAGLNTYIKAGGTIARRPGLTQLHNGVLAKRVDRLWLYETLDSPPATYLIASVFNSGSGQWELYYQRMSDPSAGSWTQATSLRQINNSTAPHEGSVGRGLFYVKGFPTGASGEKLGTVILDGAGGSMVVRPWGILGPTVPARITGAVAKTTTDTNAVTTSISINTTTGFPSTPFPITIDFEDMNVTNVSGAGPYTLTVTRGYNGTFAAAHPTGSTVLYKNWSASAHAWSVNFGWRYSYCYKSITGQISNRAPLETNPDNLPSSTGPFKNLTPAITVQGHADTTNIPKIVILRQTDGGGTWYYLDEITNTGSGNITYTDNKLASAAGNADPIPDLTLSRNEFGPSLISNSPPVAAIPPKVTGTDTPEKATPITYFQGRHWYAIGNYLVFSGGPEVISGVWEESFPSGIRGNNYRLQYPIVNLLPTSTALYVFTLNAVYAVTGSTRETFSVQVVFENIGAPYGHPRAVTRFGELVAFLTNDYRIGVVGGDRLKIISDSLGSALVDAVAAGAEIDLAYLGDTDKSFLVVAAHNKTTPSLSRQYVCDLVRTFGETFENFNGRTDEFWFTPWDIPSVGMVNTRLSEGSSRRHLVFFTWNGTTGEFARLNPAATTDDVYDTNRTFDTYFTTNLFTIPPGNHVNRLRVPYLSPILHSIFVERTLYPGDTDPVVQYYADDFYSSPRPLSLEKPASRDASIGYKTIECHANRVLHRVAVELRKINSADAFEVQNLIFTFSPDSGR